MPKDPHPSPRSLTTSKEQEPEAPLLKAYVFWTQGMPSQPPSAGLLTHLSPSPRSSTIWREIGKRSKYDRAVVVPLHTGIAEELFHHTVPNNNIHFSPEPSSEPRTTLQITEPQPSSQLAALSIQLSALSSQLTTLQQLHSALRESREQVLKKREHRAEARMAAIGERI